MMTRMQASHPGLNPSADVAPDNVRPTDAATVTSGGAGIRSRVTQAFTIGYATHNIRFGIKPNWYKGPIIDGFERGSRLYGANLIFFNAHTTEDIETSLSVYQSRCDGLLLFGYELSLEAHTAIQGAGIPVVTVGQRGPAGSRWHVDIDNIRAIDDATTHLIALGHRRLAMILSDNCENSRQRLAGFRAALCRAGIPEQDGLILFGVPSTASGNERAHSLLALSKPDRPTGIVCFNDQVALGVMAAAAECGIRVPDDLSVTGVDDFVEGRLSRPGLTTIRQPLREIGEAAVELLIDGLAGRQEEPTLRVVPYELIVRGSTGPAPLD